MASRAVPGRATASPGRGFQILALATLLWTLVLIVVGAVVRVTGSGLGCPDWPLCHGSLVPPLEGATLVEYSHRLSASLASALVVVTAGVVWLRYRADRHLLWLANAAIVLLVLQIALGGVTVLFELPPTIVTVHLAVAEALVAALTLVAVLALGRSRAFARPRALYVAAAVSVFVLVLTGAYVRGDNASLACLEWPICGVLIPTNEPQIVHVAHRYVAALVGAIVAWACWVAWRDGFRRMGATLLALFAAQILVGAAFVWSAANPVFQAGHLAVASAVWCVAVALAALSARRQAERGAGEGVRFREYVALTKPPIISLLLVTALGGMFVAARGAPPLGLALAVLVGGSLGAGGANALNHYLDRDIDERMSRTSRRPIPRRRVAPVDALAFGIALNVIAFAVLAEFANLLAAALTLFATLFYVLVYTVWLKRTTIHNIVIGGAAGALPPLVGWAAVTGSLDLPAFYLFAIVFFWTPAHFWALAALIGDDYGRVGVPMLPVVYGERAAGWGILLYAAGMVALTLLLFTTQAVGWLYLVVAVLLGILFVGYAAQYVRDARRATARRIYLYSMLYLALLFVSMMVDTAVRL